MILLTSMHFKSRLILKVHVLSKFEKEIYIQEVITIAAKRLEPSGHIKKFQCLVGFYVSYDQIGDHQ